MGLAYPQFPACLHVPQGVGSRRFSVRVKGLFTKEPARPGGYDYLHVGAHAVKAQTPWNVTMLQIVTVGELH